MEKVQETQCAANAITLKEESNDVPPYLNSRTTTVVGIMTGRISRQVAAVTASLSLVLAHEPQSLASCEARKRCCETG
jgi:hypothetical protein